MVEIERHGRRSLQVRSTKATPIPQQNAQQNLRPSPNDPVGRAKRSPEFADAVSETLDHARADVFAEIHRRAMKGVPEPVYQKGERVQDVDADGNPIPATITRYDNKLLLRLAAKLDPEWSEKRSVIHGGTVTHRAGLSMADIRALSPAERDQVEAAFTLLQNARNGEVKAIEHNPGEILDADFEEVDTMAALDRLEAEGG